MQANGIGADQVTQVRGFADQRLRKPEARSIPPTAASRSSCNTSPDEDEAKKTNQGGKQKRKQHVAGEDSKPSEKTAGEKSKHPPGDTPQRLAKKKANR